MKFEELLELVGDEPVFESSVLFAGETSVGAIRQQLSRWTKRGYVDQLRRGLYAIARPYRKVDPHPFVVANALVPSSYVSLQSALRHHGLIPEHVPTVTSVTTGRPGERSTPLGPHLYHHIAEAYFWGYDTVEVARGQDAFVATREKALLDLVYLRPGGADRDFLESLRLQDLDGLDLEELERHAERWDKPKLRHAAAEIRSIASDEEGHITI